MSADLDTRIRRLYARWPEDEPLRLIDVVWLPDDRLVRLTARAQCDGLGWRLIYADMPVQQFADEDTMVEAARSRLRIARNDVIAAWQSQILEA